ncbi:hypothetical protein RHSIM_Rhsim01G0061600 [Rhododendron simsii]|uniref:Uncharacterized protein n=1 Tax=Rhododendron simsii TaxID=118357 RepID=A0A834HKJ5_RHOSS|nr:hypothetical protein RHSIM_Rhsim01G0061600 [Rhododendron simsii]
MWADIVPIIALSLLDICVAVMVLASAVSLSSIAGVPTAPFSKEFAPAVALRTCDSTGLAISVGTCGTIGWS